MSASATPAITSTIEGAVWSRRAISGGGNQHREQDEQDLDRSGHC